jgi:transposase
MNTKVLSIDLAKRVFHLHGVDKSWQRVYSRKVRRDELLAMVLELKPQTVVMESCASAHYWGREF